MDFLLRISVPCSAMAIALLQVVKTKGVVEDSRTFGRIAILFNFGFAVLYTMYFTNLDIYGGLWVGVFITVGTDTIYKSLEGKNLLKSFSEIPVKESKKKAKPKLIRPIDGVFGKDFFLSDPYGWRKLKGLKDFHKGTDYAPKGGKKLNAVSVADGTITEIKSLNEGNGADWGNRVYVKSYVDGKPYLFQYAHLKSFGNIKVGQKVKQGHILGELGNTGKSYGVHLHLGVYKDGVYTEDGHMDFADLLFREEGK